MTRARPAIARSRRPNTRRSRRGLERLLRLGTRSFRSAKLGIRLTAWWAAPMSGDRSDHGSCPARRRRSLTSKMLPVPAAFSNRTSGKISRGHGSRIEPHCGRRPLGAGHRRTEVCLYLRTGNIGGHEPPSLGSAQTDQAARSGLFDRGSCDRARDCPGDSDHRGGTDDGAASWLLSKPAHLR